MIQTARRRLPPCRSYLRRSQTEFAVRAEADKVQARLVRLAVDQDEVGPDVAIAVIAPLAAERVIEIPPRQRLVLFPHRHGLPARGIEVLGAPPRLLPLVVAPEAAGVPNSPHSGSRAACPAGRRSPVRRVAPPSSPRWFPHWAPAAR